MLVLALGVGLGLVFSVHLGLGVGLGLGFGLGLVPDLIPTHQKGGVPALFYTLTIKDNVIWVNHG